MLNLALYWETADSRKSAFYQTPKYLKNFDSAHLIPNLQTLVRTDTHNISTTNKRARTQTNKQTDMPDKQTDMACKQTC